MIIAGTVAIGQAASNTEKFTQSHKGKTGNGVSRKTCRAEGLARVEEHEERKGNRTDLTTVCVSFNSYS
jgi:lysophospholipase L1-like esterase